MHIESSLFLYINIFIGLIYLVFAIISLKKGLLFQVISLVWSIFSLFAAYFVSPILAARFSLIKVEEQYEVFGIEVLINTIVYFVIIFLIIKLVFILISPLLKKVSDVPVIGWLNKLGGLLVGVINATILVLLLSLLLDTPVFSNGQEIKQNTAFKYCEKLSDTALKLAINNINKDSFKDVEDFDIDDARENFTEWLIKQGVLDE